MRTKEITNQLNSPPPADSKLVDWPVVELPDEPPVLHPVLSRALFVVIAQADGQHGPAAGEKDSESSGSALAS